MLLVLLLPALVVAWMAYMAAGTFAEITAFPITIIAAYVFQYYFLQ